MISFILIRTDPGKEYEVFKALENFPEIKEKHGLFGEFDVICKVDVANEERLTDLVSHKIRAIKGIAETKTFIGTKI